MKARLKVKAKLFVVCFAVDGKYTEKKNRPSIFITHHAIFYVENSVRLTMMGYSTAF